MKRSYLLMLLTLGWTTAVHSQEKTWTLEDCMKYAVENSPSVKKTIYRADSYEAERNAAVASFFPAASATIGAQYNYGRTIDPETNTYSNVSTFNNSYGASLSIPIFTGGQLINQWLMSKSNRRMGLNDIEKAKEDLALKTMQYYLDALYYQGTIRMAAEKLEESNRTLYKTRRQAELGQKGRADVAQFEAQAAADDYSLTHQTNLYNTAMIQLKESMNFPTDSCLKIDTIVPKMDYLPAVENIAEIFDYASNHNSTARQADFQWQQSKYEYRIYKGKLLPSIYFYAGLSTNYFKNLSADYQAVAFNDQFSNNLGKYFSFSLSFPLFDGLSRVTNVRKAHNSLKIAQENKTEVLRQLQTAIEQSVMDRQGYAKESIQMQKKVESDGIAYTITKRKYEEGLMSPLDVQNSASTLLSSKADLLQKQLMYLMKCKLVDYYKGVPLY